MTVTSETRAVRYQGDGANKSFTYSFKIPTAEEVVVKLYDTLTETYTTISSSNYGITGIGSDSGGTVTYPTSGSAIPSTTYIYIQRVVDYKQEIDITESSAFLSSVLEAGLDDMEFQIQQLKDGMQGSIRLEAPEVFSTPLPPKTSLINKLLGFGPSGELKLYTEAGGYLPTVANTFLQRNSTNAAFQALTSPEVFTTINNGLFPAEPYNSGNAYSRGEHCKKNGKLFYLDADSSTGDDPASGAPWVEVFDFASRSVDSITANATLTTTTSGTLYKVSTAGTITIDLPAPSAQDGTEYEFVSINTGVATIQTPSGNIVNGTASASSHSLISGDRIRVVSDGTNWVIASNTRKIGTSANNLLALDTAGKIPAVDGSQLTNLPSAGLPVAPYVKFGGLPEVIDANTMWFFNGIFTLPGGNPTVAHKLQRAAGYDVVDMTTTGLGGRDTGTLASFNAQTAYFFLAVHDDNASGDTDVTLNRVIASLSLSTSGVTLPANYSTANLIRMPFAMIYDASKGFRSMHMTGGQPWGAEFTDWDTGGTQNLPGSDNTAGTGSYTDVDASGVVPNNARLLHVQTRYQYVSAPGACYASAPGVTDDKLIGSVNSTADQVVLQYWIRCSSTSIFQIKSTVGTKHSTVVTGYVMSDDC